MTATILVVIALLAILIIGRICKDANLGTGLLVTLAFSIAVGLGVKGYTSNKSVEKKAKIESVANVNHSMPMQAVLTNLASLECSPTGAAGKDTEWYYVSNNLPTTCDHILWELDIGNNKPLDSS